jgi:hypothetical protein
VDVSFVQHAFRPGSIRFSGSFGEVGCLRKQLAKSAKLG